MYQNFKNGISRLGSKLAVGVALVTPLFSRAVDAATFDASTYAPQILGCVAGALVIGGAVFALTVSIKSTKWARKAL